MKGTLFFVHGTGVRNEGWVPLFQRVQDYARLQGFDGVRFEGCAWGPKLGVRLDLLPQTLPVPIVTKGDAAPTPEEIEKAAWSFLLDDPLFELRLAAEGAAGEGVARPGALMPDQAAEALLRQLAPQAGSLALEGTGLSAAEVAKAAEAVAASTELQRAALAIGEASDPDLVRAAARSVVAHVLAAHRSDPAGQAPAALFDGERRDAAVRAIEKALLPDVRGFRDWLKEKVTAFALQKATRFGEDRREGLLGAGTPFLGDILFYQRRGREILDLLETALRNPDLPRPIVAVGHSLGGIMLVDLLSRGVSHGKDAPPVDLLVTAGSQAPMLYAIDALEHLRPGGSATPFTPWLNIYNPQDFLSFCASRVFAGVAGIDDQEVDPGVPFPESHSAYWYHPGVYSLIRAAWPK